VSGPLFLLAALQVANCRTPGRTTTSAVALPSNVYDAFIESSTEVNLKFLLSAYRLEKKSIFPREGYAVRKYAIPKGNWKVSRYALDTSSVFIAG